MKTKWKILALCCIVMFGDYYLFMPASVHRHLKEVMPKEDFETKFQLQFALTGAPGIVLPFFAGAVVDRFGGRLCILILSTVALIGQIVASLGVEIKSWPLLLLGRFIFGLAMETLFTLNQAFLTSWFERKQLGLALGISCAASYAGLLLSQILSPIFSNAKTAAFSYWVGTIVMTSSVVSAVIIFIIDAMHEQRTTESNLTISPQEDAIGLAFQNEGDETNSTDNVATRRRVMKMLRKTSCSYWLLCCLIVLAYSILRGFIGIASGFMLERYLFKSPQSDCVLQYPYSCSSGYLAPYDGNAAYDSAGRSCPQGTFYAPVIPTSLNITSYHTSWQKSRYVFEHLKTDDIDCADPFWEQACTSNYCSRQDDATMRAGLYMGIPFLMTVATLYIFGHFTIDRMGWRVQMISIASILLIMEHSLYAFAKSVLVLPLILDGFAHTIVVSSMWPSIPLTVKEDIAGRAFGLATCIQGIGMTTFPIIISVIYTKFGERYEAVVMFFIFCAILYFLLSIVLMYANKSSGFVLSTVYETNRVQYMSKDCCIGGVFCNIGRSRGIQHEEDQAAC